MRPSYGNHTVGEHTNAYKNLELTTDPQLLSWEHKDFKTDVSKMTKLQKAKAILYHRRAATAKCYAPDDGHAKQISDRANVVRNLSRPDGGEWAFKHMADKEFADDWGSAVDPAAGIEAAKWFKHLRLQEK